ncbi:MAG: phosphatase PAP2 family protein [Candidatus Borkfalkiaceae bacterium]|nr:phosphatase PAP2 family protein [Christensenellaceae bacterium]
MDKAKIKKASAIFGVILGVYAALIAVCTFFDLEISKAINVMGEGKYYPENFFGRVFETIGVIPVYAVTSLALSIIFHFVMRENSCGKKAKIICGVIAAAICVALGYKMFKQSFGYIAIHFGFDYMLGGVTDEIAYVLAGAISTAALLYLMKDVSDDFLNKTFRWAIVVLFTAAISQAIVQSVKVFAGRARYATLNVAGSFDEYTPWYIFGGKRVPSDELLTFGAGKDAYRSFPSGHSAASAVSLTLMLLPMCFGIKKDKVSFWLLTILPVVFTLGTMISRVIEGAHFCTDVLFGSLASILGIYVGVIVSPLITKNLKLSDKSVKKRVVEEIIS